MCLHEVNVNATKKCSSTNTEKQVMFSCATDCNASSNNGK